MGSAARWQKRKRDAFTVTRVFEVRASRMRNMVEKQKWEVRRVGWEGLEWEMRG